MRLSIIVPCYNESATLPEVVRRVEQAPLPPQWEREIILVDDGSTDGTREMLQSLSATHTTLFRAKNGGKGAAVKDGLRAAQGDYCIIQDADLEYDPNDYGALIAGLVSAACVSGSRLLQTNRRYSHTYYYGSKLLTLFFNLLFNARFTDITTCYKLFPRSLVPNIVQWGYNDFTFDAVALTYELQRAGVHEVPISYSPRSRKDGKKVKAVRDGIRIIRAMAAIRLGRYAQVVKFLIGGGTGLVVNLATLYALVSGLQFYYLLAAPLAFLAAVAANFGIQRFWTFGITEHTGVAWHASKFLILQILVNVLLNMALLYIFVEFFVMHYLLAQFIISALLAVITFLASKRIVFTR